MSERLSKRERHAIRTARVNRATPTRVLITGADHPHKGATGIVDRGDVVQPDGSGPEMARVELEQPGIGGVTSCFAAGADLMPVTFSYEAPRG